MKKQIKLTLISDIVVFTILILLVCINNMSYNKYKKLAEIESDIIRCYHDAVNPDIYRFSQDYLDVIGEDTLSISEYSYCY